MKQKITCKLLNTLVLLGIAFTLFSLFITPLVLTAFFKSSEFNPTNPNAVLITTLCIYACAAPYVAALFKLKGICAEICGDEPFGEKVPRGFRFIAYCAFSEAVVYIGVQLFVCIKYEAFMLALTVIPSFILLFCCITVGFMALVFENIFRKAGEIKKENDEIF